VGGPAGSGAAVSLDRHRHGIVCACDLDDLDALRGLVETIDPVEGLVGYKLGSLLTLRHGLAGVVGVFRGLTAKALLYDHQKAGLDIPSMATGYAGVCRDAGLDGLILFPLGGPGAVDAFVGETLKAGLLPIVGGALPLSDYLVEGGGYVAADALGRILERAGALGARDFILPATDPAAIARHASALASRDARLFLPGIGPLGGDIRKALAEVRGLRAHAIIGRAIYGAARPGEAARRLAGEALAFADR
jgi:orotidine-5'-phosphate decarboxylase